MSCDFLRKCIAGKFQKDLQELSQVIRHTSSYVVMDDKHIQQQYPSTFEREKKIIADIWNMFSTNVILQVDLEIFIMQGFIYKHKGAKFKRYLTNVIPNGMRVKPMYCKFIR